MSENLFDLIAAQIVDPARVCLETLDGNRIHYGELIARSGAFANALASLGVRAGDRVAVQADKSPEVILTYLASLRSGAIFLPLNTAYTLAELEYFLSDSEPALVICQPERLGTIRALADHLGIGRTVSLGTRGDGSLMEIVRTAAREFEPVQRSRDDLAAILYTSGTTGKSKGAMLTHGNLSSNALALVEAWQFTAQDILIHALPIFHTHGLFVATNVVLISGASMVFHSTFDPEAIMSNIEGRGGHRATALMGVPTFYTRLLEHPRLSRETTAHMRLFVSGSAPLLAETHRLWRAKTDHAILERYGMTETGMIATNPYDGDRIPGAVGFALPEVSLRIVDKETGRSLAQGEIGVIEVKGPNVFKGYWRMPEKTASEFRSDGYFITGDLGMMDTRGYLHIVGRGKDLIISGGFNVYPKEVETAIDAIPGVIESAVMGVPHPDFGEGVTAIVVTAPGVALDEASTIAILSSQLAKYKLPKRVLFAADLPRNAMGKVQKNVLREEHRNLYEGRADAAQGCR